MTYERGLEGKEIAIARAGDRIYRCEISGEKWADKVGEGRKKLALLGRWCVQIFYILRTSQVFFIQQGTFVCTFYCFNLYDEKNTPTMPSQFTSCSTYSAGHRKCVP